MGGISRRATIPKVDDGHLVQISNWKTPPVQPEILFLIKLLKQVIHER